jgi:hypothetical protein
MRPSLRFPLVASGALLFALACVGPDEGALPGIDQPLGPSLPPDTHLRGQVLDAVTLVPVAGAKVEIRGTTWISAEDGTYTLQNLQSGAAYLITTKAGYDSSQVYIPLDGGDRVFNPRIRVSAPIP